MHRNLLVVVTAAQMLALTPPALAETPPPFPEFSFKRVGVPQTGTSKRITVQIDPEEQARVLAPPDPPEPEPEPETDVAVKIPSPVPGGFQDFWTSVSPRLGDSSPARLDATLTALEAVEELVWPRLDDMKRITDLYGRTILRETVGTQVSPALVAAIIAVESSGRVDAVSSAGAAGLMQLMPATAERFGVSDRLKPDQSIKGGVAYLDWLMGEFGQDPVMILAGYNAGEGSVRKHEGVPPFAETRAYVPKVLAAFRVASGLCLNPPELISDACVFVGPDG